MPNALPELTTPARPHRLRSGTAARLAGLPVTTLRVWERRYGVVAAAKTESGQRVYSPHDVSRLRLLRQLTHAGHAIGTIATLELESLQALANGLPALASAATGVALEAVVVGRSAAHALEAVPGCVLRAVYDDLDEAESAQPPEGRIGVLLVRQASLQPLAVDRVLALGAALHAGRVLVVYGFGTEASARALREAGAASRAPGATWRNGCAMRVRRRFPHWRRPKQAGRLRRGASATNHSRAWPRCGRPWPASACATWPRSWRSLPGSSATATIAPRPALPTPRCTGT